MSDNNRAFEILAGQDVQLKKNERQQFNDLKSNHLFTSNKEILPGSLISGVQALPKEQ